MPNGKITLTLTVDGDRMRPEFKFGVEGVTASEIGSYLAFMCQAMRQATTTMREGIPLDQAKFFDRGFVSVVDGLGKPEYAAVEIREYPKK